MPPKKGKKGPFFFKVKKKKRVAKVWPLTKPIQSPPPTRPLGNGAQKRKQSKTPHQRYKDKSSSFPPKKRGCGNSIEGKPIFSLFSQFFFKEISKNPKNPRKIFLKKTPNPTRFFFPNSPRAIEKKPPPTIPQAGQVTRPLPPPAP